MPKSRKLNECVRNIIKLRGAKKQIASGIMQSTTLGSKIINGIGNETVETKLSTQSERPLSNEMIGRPEKT